jgi:ribosomal protein S3
LLSTIKDILKIIRLGKNVGYKIALSGRINSADKSRLIFITRKNVPLQVFDKNMNFAYSQAKARIGVFGIKI